MLLHVLIPRVRPYSARELPPAKFTRTFYGLFWKIDGVDALVFAVTTQTTEDGDLYVEYMDSGERVEGEEGGGWALRLRW